MKTQENMWNYLKTAIAVKIIIAERSHSDAFLINSERILYTISVLFLTLNMFEPSEINIFIISLNKTNYQQPEITVTYSYKCNVIHLHIFHRNI